MSDGPKHHDARVLVIGAQGVLGTLVARAFDEAGWQVTRGARRCDSEHLRHVDLHFRHVDLEEPETLERALAEVDTVVNTVPDENLVARAAHPGPRRHSPEHLGHARPPPASASTRRPCKRPGPW